MGIRPDIINMSIVVGELEKRKIENVFVHTGQHYSYFFDELFFEELNVRRPDHHLAVRSGTQASQTARLLERSEKVMVSEHPDLVFSFSDANTALTAIAATKLRLKVAHLEAGMRSNDWRMPEEKNRRVIDHISDYLFPPTRIARNNLLREGISSKRIFLVGKIIADVLCRFMRQIERSPILDDLDLTAKDYVVATAHRPENVDDPNTLRSIVEALGLVGNHYGVKVIYPIHPRSRASIKYSGIKLPKCIRLVKPLGFFEFARLESQALCLLTDSGTVQEEGCIFRVPCVTMRISTERQETVETGSNLVAGVNSESIFRATKKMVEQPRNWRNPYDVGAAKRIVDTIVESESEILRPRVWA